MRIVAAAFMAAAWLAAPAVVAQSPAASAAYDRGAYTKAVDEVFVALHEFHFDRLERLYGAYGWPGSRSLDGTWMVQAFPAAFELKFAADPPGAIEALFAKWKARDSGSGLRSIAEAFAWLQRAWLAKGSACYAESPRFARKAFNASLERAAQALRESEAGGRESPLWHTAAILLAGAQGRPAHELDVLLDEGVRRFPGFRPLYTARLRFLMPDWGGDFAGVDRFIREAAKRNAAVEGRAFYAWLYVDIAAAHYCERWFEASPVEWAAMKDGFEDIIERHPDAWNRNLFATFACRARDAAVTRRLLAELGPQANLGAYSRGISTANCREMSRPQ